MFGAAFFVATADRAVVTTLALLNVVVLEIIGAELVYAELV